MGSAIILFALLPFLLFWTIRTQCVTQLQSYFLVLACCVGEEEMEILAVTYFDVFSVILLEGLTKYFIHELVLVSILAVMYIYL